MWRKSISRTLLVTIWLFSFAISITPGCSANSQDSIGIVYANYGELIQKAGKEIESMAVFLGDNTENIVESSSDRKYIQKLIIMERDFKDLIVKMSKIEVPEIAVEYHSLINQALVEYKDMINLLLKSSNSKMDNERKEFLDKAAMKVTRANELANKANRIKPDLEMMFENIEKLKKK